MGREDLLAQLKDAFLGEETEDEVVAIAEKIVAAEVDAMQAVSVASEAIRVIGDAFEEGELYLPDLMIAGRKMEVCMAILRPHLQTDTVTKVGGQIVLGTVSGDIHDIGKNLVGTMLTIGGFEITDLGVNVPPLEFIKAAKAKRVNMIALSALMTASLPYQREVLDLLREMGVRDQYFVIVGGGPVTPEFARSIGADGWAANAASALKLCDTILASGQHPPVAEPFVV